jgi:hypothetical protein
VLIPLLQHKPPALLIDTRQERSLAAVGFCGRLVTVREICRLLPRVLPRTDFCCFGSPLKST